MKACHIALLLIAFFSLGCSTELESPSLSANEELFEQLIIFESELGQTWDDPFYGGVTFGGKAPEITHLKIFVIGSDKVDQTRSALEKVFGEEKGQAVEIIEWERNRMNGAASKSCCWVSGVVWADFDEQVGRVRLGVSSLDTIGRVETLISEKAIARDAVILNPAYEVVKL